MPQSQATIETADPALLEKLVLANRILDWQKVVDAFGHVSVRHDKDPGRFLMLRHLAPALVEQADLVTFDLDSVPIDRDDVRFYSERFIHGEIYKARPDVISVV